MVLLQQHVVPKSPSILLLPSSSCGCWIGEDEWGIQFFHEPSPPPSPVGASKTSASLPTGNRNNSGFFLENTKQHVAWAGKDFTSTITSTLISLRTS